MKGIAEGSDTFSRLPIGYSSINWRCFLKNISTLGIIGGLNNVFNPKLHWVFFDTDCNNLQLIHSLTPTEDGIIRIFKNNALSVDQVLLGYVSLLNSYFASITNKSATKRCGLKFLTDLGTDDLKSTTDPTVFITANQLGIAGDGKDPQLVIILKVFSIEVGKAV